jgi:hypothetical protein
MAHTYIAFIDESGDEGFNFAKPPKRLSSEWFVMSAVMCKTSDLAGFQTASDNYLQASGKKKPFHFADVRHEDRIGFINQLMSIPFSHASVLAHKPSPKITEAKMLGKQSHFLFYYTAKLLLERITWFCEYGCGGRENNSIQITFSDRGQLKYERLITYLDTLFNRTAMDDFLGVDVRNHDIKWKYLTDDSIDIKTHNSSPGLQAADAVASSLRAALEFTPHFATEHRYAKLLAPRVWSRYLKVINYGLKFLPEAPSDEFEHTNRLHWLRHYRWLHINK